MGILKWISGCLDKSKLCDHDWEYVPPYMRESNWEHDLREKYKTDYTSVDFNLRTQSSIHIGNTWFGINQRGTPLNRICMKCAKCDNQIDKVMHMIDEGYKRTKEKQRMQKERAEKAKKLWKENCLFHDETNNTGEST